jgi:hypothetical protein
VRVEGAGNLRALGEEQRVMRKVKIFKSYTFAWWQLGLLKISVLALGLAVGSTWPDLFAGWRELLVVLFVAPAFYVSYVWIEQL